MIRSILVPVDGSPSSDSALEIGCSIAGLTKAVLTGLVVEDERRFMHYDMSTALAGSIGVQPMTMAPIPPEQMLEEEAKIEEESAALSQRFEEQCTEAQVRGSFIQKRGIPTELIIDAARRVDFIIMGNSGQHAGVEHLKSGFTKSILLHDTTRPVLVVPEDPQGDCCLVIAYDGSAPAERTLQFVGEFAELTELCEVHVLHVCSNEEDAKEFLQTAMDYLGVYDLNVKPVWQRGKPEESILAYAKKVDASVLALGAFGNNTFSEKIFGSTTTSVLKQAESAVLLVP